MDDHADQRLEELIHRELAQLPEVEAPSTLAPRVFKAIQVRAQHRWWRRPWTTWPFPLQMVSVAIFCALAGSVFLGGVWAWNEYLHVVLTQGIAAGVRCLDSTGSVLSTLARTVVAIWQAYGQIWFVTSAAMVVATYLTCVGVGTVCFQLAVKKR